MRDAEAEARLATAHHANGLTTHLPALSAGSSLIDAQRDLVDHSARVHTALAAV